jgi:transposase
VNRYSKERKSTVIHMMMPPHNIPIPQLEMEAGISDVMLYTWRKEARLMGLAVPADGKNPEQWSSADKFAVVLETASMNEAELGAYCREKGLCVEQIAAWREACVQANTERKVQAKAQQAQTNEARQLIKRLEQELRRKDKALAEAATLLVLQKKARTIWGGTLRSPGEALALMPS